MCCVALLLEKVKPSLDRCSPSGDVSATVCVVIYQLLAVKLLKQPNGRAAPSCCRPNSLTVNPTLYRAVPSERHLHGADTCYKSRVQLAVCEPVPFRTIGHRFACAATQLGIHQLGIHAATQLGIHAATQLGIHRYKPHFIRINY